MGDMCFEKKTSSGRCAAQVVSHHQRFCTRLFGLACHESPFTSPRPPSFWGLERPPPPARAQANFPPLQDQECIRREGISEAAPQAV